MGKKTLVISEIFPPIHGGSGRWLYELYRRLAKDEYLIAAGMTNGDREFDANNELNIIRMPLSSKAWGLVSIEGIRFYAKSLFSISRLIKKEKVTQIHCGRCLPEGVLGLLFKKLKDIPFVCFVHGEDIETASTSKELTYIVKAVLKNSSAIIANSENTKQILKKQWMPQTDKVHVLHPGMDSTLFVPADHDNNIRNTLGWCDRHVLLTVGRLQKRKGQDMLIKAMPTIIDKFNDILYVIIGDGEEKKNLLALIDKFSLNDHVKILSNISDEKMIQCYQQCTLFILPNRTIEKDIEGFGMVLAEAQSCGKPVLAGESGGTAETMIIGNTGYVVDCTNPQTLANKVNEMLGDSEKLRMMGKQARLHAVNHLDWNMHVKNALTIFESLQ